MVNEDALRKFVYWIGERESIRKRRDGGAPRPWTTDPILNCYHFCNVRREDDRGTKELHTVVRNHKVGLEDLPWAYTAARMFNKAASLDTLLRWGDGGWDILKGIREQGDTVFHTAYVVSTCGRSMDKIDYVREVCTAVKGIKVPMDSLDEAYRTILAVKGLGTFMAGQVVADLKNDVYLIGANDWYSWSSMGPGSKKGLDFIFGPGTTVNTYQGRMDKLTLLLPKHILDMEIHMQDLQNCLCEFSKFMRLDQNLPGRRRPY